MKNGSALVMALWLIAVLSIMVLSFASEAKLQTGINVYVRERNRVNRLVDAGQVLGEVVMLGYEEAIEWTDGEDAEKLFEDDRWYLEKRALKCDSHCKIGPVVLDEDNPDSGTVTVEIELTNSGEKNAINVNELYEGGDTNYRLRWQMILAAHGVDEELEVEDEDGKKVNFMDMLIASWNDWRDEDDTATAIDGDECGAEKKWYQERFEDDKVEEEDRRYPRNASIPDIKELAYVRGFRSYPSILTGGLLYPDKKEDEDNPRFTGIVDLLGTTGTSKLNANSCTVEQLLTVPGIFNEEDVDDQEESREIAQAIVDTLRVKPDYDVDETRDWWPYKDWNDLTQRVLDNADVSVPNEASEYFEFVPTSGTVFKVTITGSSGGMSHSVHAECYVKDKKVRYMKWRED